MKRVLMGKGLEKGIEQAEVLEYWPEVAGNKLAEHAEAIAFETGILFLRVSDSAWRNELSMMKESLVEKINERFNEKRVSRIHLV